MVRGENQTAAGLNTSLHGEADSAVIRVDRSRFHVGRHLDARVLRRGLHGGVPFDFLRSELERQSLEVLL